MTPRPSSTPPQHQQRPQPSGPDRVGPSRRTRGHAALGARWLSAGLAVAGTVGITTYLEYADLTAEGSIEVLGPVAPDVTVPPPPDVRIVVDDPRPTTPTTGGPVIVPSDAPSHTPTTAPTTAPTSGPPTPPTAPPTTAPRRRVHATTRGSNG